MEDKAALNDLRKNLALLDEKRRVGKDETAKLILAASTILMSFIAISMSKDASGVVFIKVSLVSLSLTIFLCLYQFYLNNVLLHSKVIGEISEAIQEESSAQAAWDRVRSLNIPNSWVLQKTPILSFLTFTVALISLVVRVFIIS